MTLTERKDWSRFRSTGDLDARNRLVERHLGLVHHFAGRLDIPSDDADRGDLVSVGTMGLMDAVSAFDPDQGVEPGTLWSWKWDLERGRRVALHDVAGSGGSEGVEDRLTREAEVRRLREELEALDEREQLVLRLYHLEGRTLREIGARLKLTESRISQIRSGALRRLRERMGDLREAA